MNVLQKESKIHKPLVRLSWGSQKEDITANLMKIREIRESVDQLKGICPFN